MRASGVLMGISSLPSAYGIGCFSKEAYEFVDTLEKAGQGYWQILPLGPTGYGDSPYQSCSTFAGNPYFIDLEELIRKGLLTREECDSLNWGDDPSYVDYEKIYNNRYPLLRRAFERADIPNDDEYQSFVRENQIWLKDYALYMAIKDSQNGESWLNWPQELRDRSSGYVRKAEVELAAEVAFYCFLQYLFGKQWKKLKEYANQKGIRIIGDLPIYVALDSADVWASPELFQVDEDFVPKAVAGCPPDAFSATGQLWGNPLYSWKQHKATGYAWWIQRMTYCMERYDMARIDHFRGFDEYYAIPYGDATAENGQWEEGPGLELFEVLKKNVPNLQVIAEDLGLVTESVEKLVRDSGFPGMKVLQFAFDGSENSNYLPHKYEKNCVVYTGTHDNPTTRGWLEELYGHDNEFVRAYINCYDKPVNDCVWGLIRTALASVADLAVIPVQDYLCLGNEARMNAPATLGLNWKWRLQQGQIADVTVYTMRELNRIYGRLAKEEPEEKMSEEA